MLVTLVHVHVKPEHVDTKTNGSKARFRASQVSRIKARPAGNGAPLPRAATPSRGAWGAPCGRASGRPFAALPRLAIGVLWRRHGALRLTAQKPAESCFTTVGLGHFIEATRRNHEESVQEPGNLRFDVIQSEADPTRFVLYEAWRDADAMTAHKKTPHYRAWRETVADWMAEPREGIPYRGLFPASE